MITETKEQNQPKLGKNKTVNVITFKTILKVQISPTSIKKERTGVTVVPYQANPCLWCQNPKWDSSHPDIEKGLLPIS